MDNSHKNDRVILNTLLVDDEPLLRLQIKSLIDWEAMGFRITAEASDGEEALALLKAMPNAWDILITDISMPKLDGVALIRSLVRQGHDLPTMVLSNYGDYRYVRESFSLGITDYVLKSELDEEGFCTALNKLRTEWIRRRQISSKEPFMSPRKNENPLENVHQRHSLLLEALSGEANTESWRRMAAEAGLGQDWHNTIVALLQIDRFRLMESQSDLIRLAKLQSAMRHFMSEQEMYLPRGGIFQVSQRQYILVATMPNEEDGGRVRERFTNLLLNIQSSFEHFFNMTLSIGMSSIGDSIESLPLLGEEAQLCLKLRIIYGLGQLIGPHELEQSGMSMEDRPSSQAFASALVEIFQQDEDEFRTQLAERCLSMRQWLPPDKTEALHYLISLNLHLLEQLDQIGVQVSDYFTEKINFYDKLIYFETIDEMVSWLAEFYHYLHKSWHEVKNSSSSIVKNALLYMQEHFDEPIRLRVLSQHCHVSESYLSRLFTQVQGETVISYLTKLRLAEARRLLRETNERLTDIALAVGYENQEHFCRLFRRYYAMSPGEYRQNVN